MRVADQLRQVSTQEVPAHAGGGAGVAARRGALSARRRAALAERAVARGALDLLAQIDRAAKRVSESGRLHDEIRQAIGDGRLDEAREQKLAHARVGGAALRRTAGAARRA